MAHRVYSVSARLSTIFIKDICYRNENNETMAKIERTVNATPSLIYRIYGIYPLTICIPALILNIIFVYVAVYGAMEKRLPRKLYIFLVNRSIGDIMYLLLTMSLAFGCILQKGHFPIDILAVILVANYVSFWASTVSFVSLCLLKLCALVMPLQARKYVTTRRCFLVISLSWLTSFAYTIIMLLLVSLTIVGGTAKWTRCTLNSCIRVAFFINCTLEVGCYFLTLAIFGATLVVSQKIQHNSQLSSRSKTGSLLGLGAGPTIRRSVHPLSRQVCLRKLALSIAIFALLYALPTVAAIRYMFKFNECFYSLGWYRSLTTVGAIRISFVLRTMVDPIINFCTHRRLREALVRQFTSRRDDRRRHYSGELELH